MISRMSFTKINAILWTIEAVNKIAKERTDFVFVLVGRVNTQIIYSYVKHKINTVNSSHNRQVIIFDNSLSANIKNLIILSDIVIGVAKVCFEGMLNKKPVIVVGQEGCPGVVDVDDKIRFTNMAYNNFSSREITQKGETIQKIYSEITKLLDNQNICIELGSKGFKWVKNNLDISKGIDTYISTYENLMKKKNQQFLPLRYAFYGIIIIILGKFKGFIRRLYLSLKLNKEYLTSS